MKIHSRSQFASWFEAETKKYVGQSDSYVPPSDYEKAANLILGKISGRIEIPSPYGTENWKSVYRYGERIWDKNSAYLNGMEIPDVPSVSSAYSDKPSTSCDSQFSSSASGIVKRHNFDSALRKIQKFSNEVPYLPTLDKFETDGGLFGWGDHYINGYEMNRYVEKVQDIFQTHHKVILKTIQEFREIYSTFDYLDKEYLTGIVQTANAAALASEGAKVASSQAKAASEQAKAAADKALKNEEDLKKDVENLCKLIEKIRSIKEDLSTKIETVNASLSQKIQKTEQEFSAKLLSQEKGLNALQMQSKGMDQLEKKISDMENTLLNEVARLTQQVEVLANTNEDLTKRLQETEKHITLASSSSDEQAPVNNSSVGVVWAYIIGGLGLVCSLFSLFLR